MREAEFIKVAKALADPTRARMLEEVRSRTEMTCGDVCNCFPKSQPTMSHHIKCLADSGVITCRKEGQFHVLTVNEPLLLAFAERIVGGAQVRPVLRSSAKVTPPQQGNTRQAATRRPASPRAAASKAPTTPNIKPNIKTNMKPAKPGK